MREPCRRKEQGGPQAPEERRPLDGAPPARAWAALERSALLGTCARALHERALLVDPTRLAARVARLLCAGSATSVDLGPVLDEALRELEAQDRAAEERGERAGDPFECDHSFLIFAFGIPPERARAAALAFNALAAASRQAFFACVVERRALAREEASARRVRAALEALFLVRREARGGEP